MKKKEMTKHHRRPRSLKGSQHPDNISFVSEHRHRAWHLLFQNFEAQVIAEIINRIWLDPKWKFLVIRR